MHINEFEVSIPKIAKSLGLSPSDPHFVAEIQFFHEQIGKHPDLAYWDMFSLVRVFKFGFINQITWDKKQQLISIIGDTQGHPDYFLHYRGRIKLASMKGIITRVDCELIFENDHFLYKGPNVQPEHHFKLNKAGRGDVVGGYSISTLKDGSVMSFYFDMDDLRAAEERGISAGNADVWQGDFKKEMYRKCVITATDKRWREMDLFSAQTDNKSAFDAPVNHPSAGRGL